MLLQKEWNDLFCKFSLYIYIIYVSYFNEMTEFAAFDINKFYLNCDRSSRHIP